MYKVLGTLVGGGVTKRCERMQRDSDNVQKDLTKNLRKRLNCIEIPTGVEVCPTTFRKAVRNLTNGVNKAA